LQRPDAAKLQATLPLREFADVETVVARLRMTKSEAELTLIRRSIDATMAAHRAAWERMAPGLHEYQIAATMSAVYFDAGCARHAYGPIVGSGPNSVILHYDRNSRRFDAGELVLMDVGAECDRYAADITRTVPASERFSERQREIYRIVLGAQEAVIAAVKPGMSLGKSGSNSLYRVAVDYIDSHGTDQNGDSLSKYFTHGIGHHIGLDVHDAADPSVALAPGMVITVEPGVYIPEENIGIRIEDMVLVTEDGAEVLTSDLPKGIQEIEKAIRKGS
jgi:Xaa-Pro aminopeptidase